jgi:XTP/dITP diphosphohydrolase
LHPKLLLATNNQGKASEYRSLFQGLQYFLVTLADEAVGIGVDEVGGSFEENAGLKAAAFAAETGLLTLADDSGLEVDALGGEPGVLSARYAGEDASDIDRVNLLLSRMRDVPWPERTARFRCVIAIARPGSKVELCHGECQGIITFEPRGDCGFGYDPVFYLPELDRTMSELTMEEKNRLSHRGQAAREAIPFLSRLYRQLTGDT